MTGDLQLPAGGAAPAPPNPGGAAAGGPRRRRRAEVPAVVPGVAARTGPGQMLQFRGQMLAVEGELAKLRDG